MPLNIFLDFLYIFLFFLQFGPEPKGGNTVSKASDLLDLTLNKNVNYLVNLVIHEVKPSHKSHTTEALGVQLR